MKKFGIRNLRALFALTVVFAGCAFPFRANAQGSDNFADATVLTDRMGTVTGDNTGFTAEAGEPKHAGVAPTTSAWFKWVAPDDGLVTLDTIG